MSTWSDGYAQVNGLRIHYYRSGGEKPPVVGGHSLGAETSMHLAANNPNLTRGILLEDPPITLPGEKFGSGEQSIKLSCYLIVRNTCFKTFTALA